jgi:hypothetical protein
LPVSASDVGLETVLRAVRLVGDDDDVGTLAEHRHAGLASLRRELVDGGEEHAAGLDRRELLAKVLAAVGLIGRGAQRPAAIGEGLEQLAVEVLPIGHEHDGRVLELRAVAQRHHVEQGQQRLARSPG